MKELFKKDEFTAYGRREGATYTVEIRDQNENIKAYRWFNDADKSADSYVPVKFRDMIQMAIWKA